VCTYALCRYDQASNSCSGRCFGYYYPGWIGWIGWMWIDVDRCMYSMYCTGWTGEIVGGPLYIEKLFIYIMYRYIYMDRWIVI